jgi:hypothetical protein
VNEMTCKASVGMDRKDLAIGKIIRLLPLLPVKELDAMGDRLRQKLGPILQQLDAAGTTIPRLPPTAKPAAMPAPADMPVDLA